MTVLEVQEHSKGDFVYVIRRKGNGYPRRLLDGVAYEIADIYSSDIITIRIPSSDGIGTIEWIKIHRKFIGGKSYIRDKKLNELLKE